jgi:hypothetical protein
LRGVSRAKAPRTTVAAPVEHPADLVQRHFQATAPDRLWVADITYVRTFSGWAYAAYCDGCLLPPRGGLAVGDTPAHRPRLGRPRDGLVVTTLCRARPVSVGPSLRSWSSRRIQLVVATPRYGGVGWCVVSRMRIGRGARG